MDEKLALYGYVILFATLIATALITCFTLKHKAVSAALAVGGMVAALVAGDLPPRWTLDGFQVERLALDLDGAAVHWSFSSSSRSSGPAHLVMFHSDSLPLASSATHVGASASRSSTASTVTSS